ncbi:T9SS type A sorting domain-containing protein, partial [Flavobacteriales bacterium]|nr:T9SS type A sorting domain-containing protein [Flavobacteriales bacterium]
SGDQNWDFTLYNSTLNGRIRFITQNLFTFNSYNSIIKEIKDLYNDFPDSEQYISDIDYNSYGYNLIGDLSAEMTNIDDTDIINIDIDLMPLDYYGGHTKTMPPNECSPALDAGDPQSTDISQNQLLPIGVKDIGAAERNIEIVRYNCENGNCIIVNDASGQFCTLNECEQACQNISSLNETLIDISIYPNPSSNIFNIEFNTDFETEILVTNILGEQVYIESIKSTGEFNTQIDLSDYSKGIYNLTIKNTNGISNHKLILQ